MQFTRYEDMSDEEREAVEKLGRRGQVITRDRKQPVSGLGRLMPKPAADQVQAGIPFIFNQNHFTAAWKKKGIRPPKGAPNPHHTNPDFCEYDEPTKSYRYTKAYVNHLIKKCSTAEGFEEATGMQARNKPTTDQPSED